MYTYVFIIITVCSDIKTYYTKGLVKINKRYSRKQSRKDTLSNEAKFFKLLDPVLHCLIVNTYWYSKYGVLPLMFVLASNWRNIAEDGAEWRICLRSPITLLEEMTVPNDRVHFCAQVRSCSSVGVYEFVCKSSILDRSLFLRSPSSDRSLVELSSVRTKDADATSYEVCRNVRHLTTWVVQNFLQLIKVSARH